MKKNLLLFIIVLSFTCCKSSKKAKNKTQTPTEVTANNNLVNTKKLTSKKSKTLSLPKSIVNFAKQFKGVRYKWGGTSKSGMDCSGLVYESFRAHQIYLPRISRDMARKGKKIKLKEIKEGDLLFFKTKNRRNAINHVGLVTKSNAREIEFIHATTSKGVIISNLSEKYWNKAFTEARRIL